MSDFVTLRDSLQDDRAAQRLSAMVALNRVDPEDARVIHVTDMETGAPRTVRVEDSDAAAYLSSLESESVVTLLGMGDDEDGVTVAQSARTPVNATRAQDGPGAPSVQRAVCEVSPPDRRDASGRALQVVTIAHTDQAVSVTDRSGIHRAARDALTATRPGGRPGFVLRGVDANGLAVAVRFFRPSDPAAGRLRGIHESLETFWDASRMNVEGLDGLKLSTRQILDKFVGTSGSFWEIVPLHMHRLEAAHTATAQRSLSGDLSQPYRYEPGGPKAGYIESLVCLNPKGSVSDAVPVSTSLTPRDLRTVATVNGDPLAEDTPDADFQATSPRSHDAEPAPAPDGVADQVAMAAADSQAPSPDVSDGAAAAEPQSVENETTSGDVTSDRSDDADIEAATPQASAGDVEIGEASNADGPVENGPPLAVGAQDAETQESPSAATSGFPTEIPESTFAEWLYANKTRNDKTVRNFFTTVKHGHHVFAEDNAAFCHALISDFRSTADYLADQENVPNPDDLTGNDRKKAQDRRGQRRKRLQAYLAFLREAYPEAVAAVENGQPVDRVRATASSHAASQAVRQPEEPANTGQQIHLEDYPEVYEGQRLQQSTPEADTSADPHGPSEADLAARLARLGSGDGDAPAPVQRRRSRTSRNGEQIGTDTAPSKPATSQQSPDDDRGHTAGSTSTPSDSQGDDADPDGLDLSFLDSLSPEEAGDISDLAPGHRGPGQ